MSDSASGAAAIQLVREFNDIDELCEAARGWDLDFYQLGGGRFCGRIAQHVEPRLQFANARFHTGLRQRGSTPADLRTFAIPARGQLELYWRGVSIRADQVLVFPRSRELDSVSRSDFDMFVVSLGDEVLERTAEARGMPGLAGLLDRHEVLGCDPGALETLRGLLRNLRSRLFAGTVACERQQLVEPLEETIARALVSALATGRAADSRPPSKLRAQALARAEAVIGDCRREPLTVGQLCRLTGVSQRTLEYAFREAYAVTPKVYLSAMRLNGVRRTLKAADRVETTVRQVALGWGFWHMGQFAADYRRLFGELPSVTLRRAD